jgi:hypothetical protein
MEKSKESPVTVAPSASDLYLLLKVKEVAGAASEWTCSLANEVPDSANQSPGTIGKRSGVEKAFKAIQKSQN